MKLKDIETPVSSVSGVGPALEKLLSKVDVFTISDLLSYWPRDFEDRTRHIPLSSWKAFPKVHTIAQVINHSWFGYGRMKTLRVIIDDGTAQGALICFNRPFLEKSLPVGSVIAVTGAFTLRYGELQSTAFEASWLSSLVLVCPSKRGSLCLMEMTAVMPFLTSAPVKLESFSFSTPISLAY